MKINTCHLACLLLAGLAAPASAKCESLLPYYLKNPTATTAPGAELAGTQFALVKIVAVHPDSKPRLPWHETGTLDLIKIESQGKGLPATFSVPYDKRTGTPIGNGVFVMVDCQTWDSVVLKPGRHLLAFFRLENKGWVVPELASPDVILNADQLSPGFRKELQPLFRTRL